MNKILENLEFKKKNFIHSWIKKKEMEYFLNILTKYNFNKKIKIIDIGCGSGFYSKILSFKNFKNITCLDKEKKELEKIKISKIKKIYSSILHYNLKKKYDFILSMGILEFIKDYKFFFRKITNCAKKKSTLMLLIPAINFAFFFYKIYHYFNKTIIFTHKKKKVISELKFLKWKIISIKYIFPSSIVIIARFKSK